MIRVLCSKRGAVLAWLAIVLTGSWHMPLTSGMDDDESVAPTEPGEEVSEQPLDEVEGNVAGPVIELPPPPDGPDPLASTVRVNSTIQPYDARLPWRKANINSRSGLGILVAGHEVLVTASLVADATHIELEQPESGRKIGAKILCVDYEAELAVVTAADESEAELFFAGSEPIDLDEPAARGDELHVWQIESNGRPVVTPIQLLRIQIGRYRLPGQQLLTYVGQGSVRSHAGSYTVPVMRDGKLAGLMMRYDNNQQLSRILPAPIIRRFIEGYREEGEAPGFPTLGIRFSSTLDEQFRRYLGIDDITGGVFIRDVATGSSADLAGIRTGDVLLAVEDFNIDARGFYEDPEFGRLAMSHLFSGKRVVGDRVEVILWRDNSEVTVNVELLRPDTGDHLVEPHMIDRATPFIICGGLVFQELTEPYLRTFGRNWTSDAPARLLQAWRKPEEYERDGWHKIVFLNGVLPTPAVQGYEKLGGLIVTRVNGMQIHEIGDLARALESPRNGLHKIELIDYPHIIHVDAAAAERDNRAVISQTYRVPVLRRLRPEPMPDRREGEPVQSTDQEKADEAA